MILQEYLVKVGAQIDKTSISQLQNVLQSAQVAMKSLGSVIYGTLITGLVKTIVSLNETTQSYERMASAQNKSTQAVRASQQALKAMGKTMNEINQSERLTAQYNSLVKIGKQLALPKANQGIKNLRGIIAGIAQIQFVGTYALQWINQNLMRRIQVPLRRIKGYLANISAVLQKDMPKWTDKIAVGLNAVLRILTTTVDVCYKIASVIYGLPDGVKKIGAVIASVFTIANLGTAGKWIAALSTLMLLIDDFITYRGGGQSALPGIWQMFDSIDLDGIQEKVNAIFEPFNNLWQTFKGIFTFDPSEGDTFFTDLGGKIIEAIKQGATATSKVGKNIFAYLLGMTDENGAILAADELQWSTIIQQVVGGVLDVFTKFLVGQDGAGGALQWGAEFITSFTSFVSGIFSAVAETISGMDATSIFDGLSAILMAAINSLNTLLDPNANGAVKMKTGIGSIAKSFLGFLRQAIAGIKATDIGDSINGVVSSLFSMFGQIFTKSDEGIAIADDIADTFKDFIGKAVQFISGVDLPDLGNKLGNLVVNIFNQLSKFISSENLKTDMTTMFEGLKDAAVSVVGGIAGFLGNAFSTLIENDTAVNLAHSIMQGIGNAIQALATSLTGQDGKTDDAVTGVGEKIGQTIGGAIKIGLDFLSTFFADALQFVTSEKGSSQLYKIGKAIIEGIAAGLSAVNQVLTDQLGQLIFGKDRWAQLKAQGQGVALYKQDGTRYTQEEVQSLGAQQVQAAVQRGRQTSGGSALTQAQQYAKDVLGIGYMGNVYDSFQNSWLGAFVGDGSQDIKNHNSVLQWWMNSAPWLGGQKAQDYTNRGKLQSMFNGYVQAYQTSLWGQDQDVTAKALMDLNTFTTVFNALDGYVSGGQKAGIIESVFADESYQGAENMVQALAAAEAKIQQLTGQTITIKWNYEFQGSVPPGGQNPTQNAYGGRFNKATEGIFGQDGTQYIIPITKPGRAKELILQMFGEMGSGASSILNSLGVGDKSASGGAPGLPAYMQPAAMYAGSTGSVMNNSGNEVNVPTTINVYGCGDAYATGNAVVRANESNLLRRVRGVFGA